MPMSVALHEAPAERLPVPVEAAFYFVIAESLTNTYKHAGANSVAVAIRRENGLAWAEVSDDGRGGATPGAGLGLERAGGPDRGARREPRGSKRQAWRYGRTRGGPVPTLRSVTDRHGARGAEATRRRRTKTAGAG